MSTLSAKFAGFWQFENNGADETANGLTLTNNNVATFVAGKVGQATALDKNLQQSWSRADSALLKPGDADFGICLWYKATSLTTEQFLVSKWKSSTNQRGYAVMFDIATSRFKFFLSGNGTTSASVTASTFGAPSTGVYYFIVARYDAAADLMYISVNGGAEDSAAQTGGPFSAAVNFEIGALEATNSNEDGNSDQVGITTGGNRFTASDISFLYNGGNGRSWAEILASDSGGASGGNSLTMRLIEADEL